jgi:hypothetical protein
MKKIISVRKSGLRFASAICFIAVSFFVVACDNTQGMMHEGSRSMNMGNLNWAQILIGIIIGILLGYLFARRRK